MTVISPPTTNTKTNFWGFTIDLNTAVSNLASEYVVKARERFNTLGLVLPSVWTTADIGFEVQFEHETVPLWRRVSFSGVPVRVRVPVVDDFCVADAEIMVILRAPITRMRIISIDPTTYLAVNQVAARTVKMYLSE